MTLMRSILVATDQTSESDPPIECGAALAQELRLPLVILHVFTGTPTAEDREEIARAVARWAEAADYPVKNHVAQGDEHKAIVSQARESGAEIIVIGKHRKSVIGDIFTDSTVEEVVGDTQRMVLVATDRPRHTFERLLVATDFSEPSRRAFIAASRLFPSATLDLLHAWHVPYEGFLGGQLTHDQFEAETKQKAREFVSNLRDLDAQGTGPPAIGEILLREGQTVRVVTEALDELGSDLLVIGTHGEGGVLEPRSATSRAPCSRTRQAMYSPFSAAHLDEMR